MIKPEVMLVGKMRTNLKRNQTESYIDCSDVTAQSDEYKTSHKLHFCVQSYGKLTRLKSMDKCQLYLRALCLNQGH